MKRVTYILLILALLFQIAPAMNASATPSTYSGGLLDNLPLKSAAAFNSPTFTTVTKLTDNDESTYEYFGSDVVWYTFSAPQTINSVVINNVSSYLSYVEFYDNNNVKIGEYTPITNGGVESLPTPITGVYSVVLKKAASSSYLYVREFNVGAPMAAPNVPTIGFTGGWDKWTEVNWSSTGAKWYNVKRSTTPSGPFDTIATNLTGTTYKDSMVTNGTTYYYAVTASNEAGESANSTVVSVLPNATKYTGGLLDGVALNVGTTLGTKSSTIRKATDNNEYTYEYIGSDVAWYTFSAPQTIDSVIINNASSYRSYVEFYDNNNVKIGEYTPITNGGVESLPTPITGVYSIVLKKTASSSYLYVMEFNVGTPTAVPNVPTIGFTGGWDKWTEINWSSTGAKWYNVKRSTTSSGPFDTIATNLTGTSYKDSTVASGTTYYYAVTASNEAGESANSTVVSVLPDATKYTSGLLDGVALNVGAELGTKSSTIRKMTDNNEYTYEYLGSDVAWYTFSAPQTIDSVIINNASSYRSYVEFYDNNNVKIGEYTPITNGGVESLPTPITGVCSIVLKKTASSSYLYVMEFNVGTPTAVPNVPTIGFTGGWDKWTEVNWSSTGAKWYNVKRSTTSSGPFDTIATNLTGTSYKDSTVASGTTYYYAVTASNEAGESANSTVVSVLPNATKYTGGLLDGVALNVGAELGTKSSTVRKMTDNNEYTYEYLGSDVAWYTFSAPQTINSVIINNASWYRSYVEFYDNHNVKIGEYTPITNGGVESLPTPITGVYSIVLKKTASSSYLYVMEFNVGTPTAAPNVPSIGFTGGWDKWTEINWSSTGAKWYNVKRSTTPTGPFDTIATNLAGTSYKDFTVTNGMTYYYVVTASNEAGESANSTVVSVLPNATKYTGGLLDGKALNVGAALGTSSFTSRKFTDNNEYTYEYLGSDVVWYAFSAPQTINSVVINDASSYRSYVEFYDNNNVKIGEYTPITNGGVESLPTPITGVYSVVLKSSSVLYISEFNLFGTGNLHPQLSAVVGDKQAILNWNATDGATGYVVRRSTKAGGPYSNIALVPATQLTYNDANVLGGTTYYYVVSALYGPVESANSNEVSVAFPVTVPTNVRATWTNTQVNINWDDVQGATSYIVQRATVAGGPFTVIATNVTSSSYVDLSVTAGTTYYYVVQAVNAIETSGYSIEVSVAVITAPTNVSAAWTNARVNIAWDDVQGATSYIVRRATVAGGPYTVIATNVTSATYVDLSVTPGATYYYIVQAVNAAGTSGYSIEVSVTIQIVAPTAPTHVSATWTNTRVNITWDDVPGAASYIVKRATIAGGPYTVIATNVTSATYVDLSVTAGTTYYYVVQAVNAAGSSDISIEVSVAVITAPTHVSATWTNTQVNLAWDDVPGATSYIVLRATAVGGPYTVIATNVTSAVYADLSITPGTTYYYVVQAVNAAGTSGYSIEVSVDVTLQVGVPNVPTNVVGTWTNTQVNLAWDDVPGATSYIVLRATAVGGPYTAIATNVTSAVYADLSVTPGTTYYYAVQAVNAAGTSGYSIEVSVNVTLQVGVPTAPTNVSGTWTNTQVNLNWDTVVGATYYTIKRATVAGGPYTVIGYTLTNSTYVDLSVTPGNTYYYVVQAVNAAGISGYSIEVSVNVSLQVSVPTAPTNVSGTWTDTQVNLYWDTVVGATYYTVKRATVAGGPYTTIGTTVTSATYADHSITPGTTYYYVVQAVNADGISGYSIEVSVNVGLQVGIPTAPTNVSGTWMNTQVNLNWDTVVGATYYTIKRATVAGGPYTIIAANVASATYVDLVTPGTTYYYVVQAVNADGISGYSIEVSVNVGLQVGVPTAPTHVSGIWTNTHVNLNWDTVVGATYYTVKRATVAGGPYTVIAANVTSATYVDLSVTPGNTYYYVVQAVNADGISGYSIEVSVNVTLQVVAPIAPTNVVGTWMNNQVSLVWHGVPNATSYIVSRATVAGGPYTVIAANVTSAAYVDLSVTPGATYYYVVQAVNAAGISSYSTKVSIVLSSSPQLNVIMNEETISVGQYITVSIELRNVVNIYAEDFTLKYDNTIFDYIGFEEVPGYKVYNQPTDQNGTLHFIVASQGSNYGISGGKVVLKLKLRAKARGTGAVGAVKGTIADLDGEYDIAESGLLQDSVTVVGDVNRNGVYTLTDLAIDGYYYGLTSSETDTSKYDADQTGDGEVTDDDLVYIVNQMQST